MSIPFSFAHDLIYRQRWASTQEYYSIDSSQESSFPFFLEILLYNYGQASLKSHLWLIWLRLIILEAHVLPIDWCLSEYCTYSPFLLAREEISFFSAKSYVVNTTFGHMMCPLPAPCRRPPRRVYFSSNTLDADRAPPALKYGRLLITGCIPRCILLICHSCRNLPCLLADKYHLQFHLQHN